MHNCSLVAAWALVHDFPELSSVVPLLLRFCQNFGAFICTPDYYLGRPPAKQAPTVETEEEDGATRNGSTFLVFNRFLDFETKVLAQG